jgi:hypothetical protein
MFACKIHHITCYPLHYRSEIQLLCKIQQIQTCVQQNVRIYKISFFIQFSIIGKDPDLKSCFLMNKPHDHLPPERHKLKCNVCFPVLFCVLEHSNILDWQDVSSFYILLQPCIDLKSWLAILCVVTYFYSRTPYWGCYPHKSLYIGDCSLFYI